MYFLNYDACFSFGWSFHNGGVAFDPVLWSYVLSLTHLYWFNFMLLHVYRDILSIIYSSVNLCLLISDALSQTLVLFFCCYGSSRTVLIDRLDIGLHVYLVVVTSIPNDNLKFHWQVVSCGLYCQDWWSLKARKLQQ